MGGGVWVGLTKGLLIQIRFSVSQILGQDFFGVSGSQSQKTAPPPPPLLESLWRTLAASSVDTNIKVLVNDNSIGQLTGGSAASPCQPLRRNQMGIGQAAVLHSQ